MYYPYVRGKQFELLMLREMAPAIAEWGFTPIIEPVKRNDSALKRALDELIKNDCKFILLANPTVGEFKKDNSDLVDKIIKEELADYENFSVGIHLSADDSLESIRNNLDNFDYPFSLIHNGFSEGKALSLLLADAAVTIQNHVFIEQNNSTLYRKHFNGNKVLVEDGFQSRKNREYPHSEPFSELYLTYREYGCAGFGDFLVVGNEYSEGGGPAYAIAIHLTYVDPAADDAIAVKHYVSDEMDSPNNPGGKYLEALHKLHSDVVSQESLIFRSNAVKEFVSLYEAKHFPGLGYTKKLSMQHHVELMAQVLNNEG